MNKSTLQKIRLEYVPKLPKMLRNGISKITVSEGNETKSVSDCQKSKNFFQTHTEKKK